MKNSSGEIGRDSESSKKLAHFWINFECTKDTEKNLFSVSYFM